MQGQILFTFLTNNKKYKSTLSLARTERNIILCQLRAQDGRDLVHLLYATAASNDDNRFNMTERHLQNHYTDGIKGETWSATRSHLDVIDPRVQYRYHLGIRA